MDGYQTDEDFEGEHYDPPELNNGDLTPAQNKENGLVLINLLSNT